MPKYVAPLFGIFAVLVSLGAGYRTENFVVHSHDARLSREIALAAEQYRLDLAHEWLGHELPAWRKPCRIEVREGARIAAGGQTSFTFHHRGPCDWEMIVTGRREVILASVLPHEVTHTIFATHFRTTLPRWAEEGASVTVEHDRERAQLKARLLRKLASGRQLPLQTLFAVEYYPADVEAFYSQGYSVTQFLIQQGGRRKFVDFLHTGSETGDWTSALTRHYGFACLTELESHWLEWVVPYSS